MPQRAQTAFFAKVNLTSNSARLSLCTLISWKCEYTVKDMAQLWRGPHFTSFHLSTVPFHLKIQCYMQKIQGFILTCLFFLHQDKAVIAPVGDTMECWAVWRVEHTQNEINGFFVWLCDRENGWNLTILCNCMSQRHETDTQTDFWQ